MTEAQQNYRADFLGYSDDLAQRIADLGLDSFIGYRRFRENGEERVVVLSSNDVLLVNTLTRVFEDFDPAAWNEEGIEEAFVAAEKPFSLIGRLPKTRLERRQNRTEIVCEEGTCKFHLDGNCSKKEVTGEGAMQFDHNPANQWCMDYEPTDSIKTHPPYPLSATNEKAIGEDDYRIKEEVVNNLRAVAANGGLQVGFGGLAYGLLMHLETGNVEIQIAGSNDDTFQNSPDVMFAVGKRPIGHWATGSFVKVNHDYVNMRNEAPFSTDAMTIRVLSFAVLEVAELPYIPVRLVGRFESMGEVDAAIAHQLVGAPPEIILTDFSRNLVEEHERLHPYRGD